MNISNINLLAVLGAYSIFSKLLFDEVYKTSKLIIDEEFHLPLGEEYCKFHFDKWDPKVTTLPGLYLISTLFLGPFGLCSIYWLRSMSLLFSCVNLVLLYKIFCLEIKQWQNIFVALTVSLLPPLYFFSHVYYTDVVSLTTVLLLIFFCGKNWHFPASIAGFLAIVCRQTNVIFVGIYGGKYILTELYFVWVQKHRLLKRDGILPSKNVKLFIIDCFLSPFKIINNMSVQVWLNSLCYASVIIFFLSFVWFNGSIVVGDKSAHQVSINIPQLFYFSLFCLVFSWPHFVGEVSSFLLYVKRHKLLICFLTLISVLVVHYNTVVHPYLLADNRHLVFYIWNRFYGKLIWFKYIMIPIYIFSLYVILKTIWDKSDISLFIFFVPGVVILLITQSLLEFRYFFVPYIILRLKIKYKDKAVFTNVLEFVSFCVINAIAFNIFFTRTLYWDDYEYPQRIIW